MQNMVTDSKLIYPSLGECPPVLAARLVDSNTKIAAAAIALCQSIAVAMGPDCRQHIRAFLPNFLVGMGDTKTWIRTAAISCVNTWGDQCGYRELFDGEMIADALKSGSPALRSELWGWLAEKLPNIKSVPKEEMTACIPVLLNNLEDRNADVRKNAAEAVLGVMMHTGYGPLSNACDKLKPGSQGPVKAILEKTRGNLPEKPVQKSKSASNIPADKSKANAKMGPGSTATFVKSKPKAGAASAVAKPTGRKKETEEDTSPLMVNNGLKNQRALDEQKLKTLKWNFTTPREEFVELLKDQMLAAGVNKGLITNMFHVDFKYHLRAIDMLSEDLSANLEAQRANLDLILKWLTIRFFDTNPSVILRGLEYLQLLFVNLYNDGYSMIDNEVSSFVPYLLIKIGDPKDAVRNSVKIILRQMWQLSTVQKLFPYLMEGIRSKNARQRAECLEHISLMIDQNGLSACVPSASVALKEIAKQISDRDNSVRSAALNCIVTAYYYDERALKMVGHISDKEMSLLEERIKRASKNRPVANVKPLPQAPPARAPPREPSPAPAYDEPEEEEEEVLPPPLPTIQSPPTVVVSRFSPSVATEPQDYEEYPSFENSQDQRHHYKIHDSYELMNIHEENGTVTENGYDYNGVDVEEPRPVSGPYGLDQALLQDIETQPVVCTQPKLIEFDLHFLREPSTIINPAPKLDHSLSMSPLSRMPNSMTLEWHLTQIGNRDLDRALDALAHIESLLISDQHTQLYQHEDLLVNQLVRQLEFLNQSNHPEVVNCYKRNLALFLKFLNNHSELSRNVRESTVREALRTLIMLLTEKRLEFLDPGTDMFVRVVNNVIIRVLDKSEHTAVICALIKNLYDTVNNPVFSTHYQELLMKCIWKVIKFIDSWADELQYDLIFTDIHAFLRDYPSSWWKKQPSDTPLRTIKTIMHTIVKVKGPVIGEIVRNVRGVTPDSELWTYVQKLLKHLKCTNDDRKVEPVMVDSQPDNRDSHKGKRMSKNSHDLLSEIFRKIGTKDETNEGIRMLYEFKQQYPDADINPFLQKSSQFFQDYIERGLKSIDADRRLAGVDKETGKVEVDDKDSGAYLQRLRVWQAKAGWNNAPPAATRPSATPLSPSRQDLDLEPLPIRQSQLDTSGESITADDTEVEALRKRLEKVKSSLTR
ncbi:protein mini spindles-like isoform X1 [Macrosteles quadrilineatus]|uniref:protein mini spindles-like isoform X1 n=1 Tax=Macrosteles quadrilineatus TaxID=74068 RepID=UPI0023E1541A|nr:protein mini spindles-like isoform X1 [Macrosteles quadrilineatus]